MTIKIFCCEVELATVPMTEQDKPFEVICPNCGNAQFYSYWSAEKILAELSSYGYTDHELKLEKGRIKCRRTIISKLKESC